MTTTKPLLGRNIAVIGAGIIGACCAAQLSSAGAKVTIIDRSMPGSSGASRGNAAHIAASEILPMSSPGIALDALSMLLDPMAPLKVPLSQWPKLMPWLSRFLFNSQASIYRENIVKLAQLNRQVLADVERLYALSGLSDQLQRDGALYLYESQQSLKKAASGFAIRQEYGFNCESINPDQLYQLEPELAKIFAGGYRIPQWMTVSNPQKIVTGMVQYSCANGAKFICEEIQQIIPQLQSGGAEVQLRYKNGRNQNFDQVVLAAGVWSKKLLKQLGTAKLLEAERGYNSTYTAAGINIGRALLFGDRGIVATPLAQGIRIGGWAELGGIKRPPNPKYFQAIEAMSLEIFPQLQTQQKYRWMGHRPSTPSSLPIIESSSANQNIVYATGHGHLGLTQAPTTAKLVQQLLLQA
ncbi:MAG: FAD-binding oxidoreductase [Oceanospirillaceae bacterium]|nr:FAD-binding oxidoreductase [Oceanospirillaceae bacterium]